MTITSEEALQKVVADRDRIDATVAELREVVRENIADAKRRVDPRTYIRQYPWIALGLVLGAGVAVAMTGADRKAVKAGADAAESAGEAIHDAAVDAKEFAVHKTNGDEPDPLTFADGGADQPIEWPRTLGDRVRGVADSLLYRAIGPVLDDMRRNADVGNNLRG
ncbi:MAG TPA: hypothetical protein VGM82_13335 [Gemmatimonadaceae bacterium]|jgi:hypothetical protein